MDATIKVPLEADYEGIALNAGAAPGTARYWNDGTVEVPDVSQTDLDAALANYDHAAVLARRQETTVLNDEIIDLHRQIADLIDPVVELTKERDRLQLELNVLKAR